MRAYGLTLPTLRRVYDLLIIRLFASQAGAPGKQGNKTRERVRHLRISVTIECAYNVKVKNLTILVKIR